MAMRMRMTTLRMQSPQSEKEIMMETAMLTAAVRVIFRTGCGAGWGIKWLFFLACGMPVVFVCKWTASGVIKMKSSSS
ncbi:hypothetical protein ACLKA6_001402 [Drosophila palustris]